VIIVREEFRGKIIEGPGEEAISSFESSNLNAEKAIFVPITHLDANQTLL
jgi:hypothetical protein